MGTLSRFNLRPLVESGCQVLFETGTGQGNSAVYALSQGMSRVYTVEAHQPLYEDNVRRYGHLENLSLTYGSSESFLAEVSNSEQVGRIFFLDAHFFGGADFAGHEGAYVESSMHPLSFPLARELEIILAKNIRNDWIIIDDARLYVAGSFGLGECPEFARRYQDFNEISTILRKFEATHNVLLSRLDHGYWIISPKSSVVRVSEVINIYATDSTLESPGQFIVNPNINGVTSISIGRRLSDSRFATRYFKGNGLDIGPGNDSIGLYRELFPLIENIVTYDSKQGDAQNLVNIADNSFDFVYSSHCLEHMRDVAVALSNWIRVCKPGGYLIVQVPDEDLYEKGIWPSAFNSDHKFTFTISKSKSWSPVSVNVLDLLRLQSDMVQVIQVALEDRGFRYQLATAAFDQTRTPVAECGIEFILKKL
jgi:hypothetical protein